MLPIRFGFDWPSDFREEDLWIFLKCTCVLPWGEADQPLGSKCFHNHISLIHLSISCKCFLSNDILTFFPIQMHVGTKLTLL